MNKRKKTNSTLAALPVAADPHRSREGQLTVAVRFQKTPDEQRQFNAALDGFLAELVRRHLAPQKGSL